MALPVRRTADISRILLRYGFKELGVLFGRPVDEVRGAEAVAAGQPQAITATSKNRPQRLRRVLEELGPTFIKLGQLLSTRPDLVPSQYTEEFRKLQDEVPPFSIKEVNQVLVDEFGKPADELFASFDKTPLASASLSQVHAATLPDGTTVAVKVQRPLIQKVIKEDIALLKKIAKLVQRNDGKDSVVSAQEIVETFEEAITQELDFEHEASVIHQFFSLYGKHPLFVVPDSYDEYSSERVVTMDLIQGIKITDIQALDAAGIDRHRAADNGLRVVLAQIFEHGLFHGDPHPGNVFVLPGERIAYVDYGLSATLSKDQRSGMLKLLLSIVEQDANLAIESLVDLKVLPTDDHGDEIRPHLEALFKRYLNQALGDIKFGRMVNEIFNTMRTHGLRVPRDLILLVKAVATSEAVGTILDPEFNLVASAQPYLRELLTQELKPGALFKKIRDLSRRNAEVLEKAPRAVSGALDQLQKGNVKVNIEHKGLEKLEQSIDIGSNQVAYALVIAALILAGAFLAPLDGPKIFELNALGFVSFIFAALMGVVLIVSIWREQRAKRSRDR